MVDKIEVAVLERRILASYVVESSVGIRSLELKC
jgi:hypothetical protein